MTHAAAPHPGILEVGAAGRALAAPGEGTESGDIHLVVPLERAALVAVIDGLGHGSEAAMAAREAAAVLAAHAELPLVDLVQRCHEQLRRTRGAVMSLARFDSDAASMTWAGVGNVDGVLLRARPDHERRREAISVRPGVVGYRLPPLRAEDVDLARGDTLIFVTDGIQSDFAAGIALERSPQEIADAILTRHSRRTDDALVVVARYLGGASCPS